MPDIDGWTVLAAIKGDPAISNIPVMLLTILDEKNRGFALGASEYLVKPIDRDKLIRILRQLSTPTGGSILVVDDEQTQPQRFANRAGTGRLAGCGGG